VFNLIVAMQVVVDVNEFFLPDRSFFFIAVNCLSSSKLRLDSMLLLKALISNKLSISSTATVVQGLGHPSKNIALSSDEDERLNFVKLYIQSLSSFFSLNITEICDIVKDDPQGQSRINCLLSDIIQCLELPSRRSVADIMSDWVRVRATSPGRISFDERFLLILGHKT
jgi:hypothetical protein